MLRNTVFYTLKPPDENQIEELKGYVQEYNKNSWRYKYVLNVNSDGNFVCYEFNKNWFTAIINFFWE